MSTIIDAQEVSLQRFSHPLSIQASAISELQSKVLNGNVVSDGNNVVTFLTEFFGNTVADLTNKACQCFTALYPENAQSSTDLYRHLSDFDYIGLFATPANMTVELVFDRNFLIDKAVQVDGTIHKIVLPEFSKFTVGEYTFGLMYPIEIRVRKAPVLENGQTDYDNSVITVMWDTSRQNPLQTLESHILEHRDFVKDGQTLTAIEVPIYQFSVSNHLSDAIASSGFARRFSYTDKFYAVRVFHFKNGQWNEMAVTLSNMNYDTGMPTAMIKVLPEIGKLEVVVPQIYFNAIKESARIGNRILVKIYTTTGEMNLDVSEYSLDRFQASFLLKDDLLIEDDDYSSMLKRIPTIYVIPLTTRIASGTNGATMEEIRERVKHHASYTVKITDDDLTAYFKTKGFQVTKELDNITDRVYAAHKVITDKTGATIASGNCGTKFLPAMTAMVKGDDDTYSVPGYSDITVLDQNNITIQPSAIYKYNSDEDLFVMLSDEEKTLLANKAIDARILDLNNNLYTYSPFHVRLSLDENMPIAGSYDLFKPALRAITFDWENTNTPAEMAIYSAEVKVLSSSGKAGYRLSVAVFKTTNIEKVPSMVSDGQTVRNIQVMLSTSSSRGVYMYMLGTYNGQDSMGHDVFIFDITSNFRITPDSMIDVSSMYDMSGNTSNNFLDIGKCSYALSFFIREDFIEDPYPMQGVDITGVPGELDGYVYLCRQKFTMSFGEALPLLQNNVSLSTSGLVYDTYGTTEFSTYQAPVYDRWTALDVTNQVVDETTGKPVDQSKIGQLKLAVSYAMTKDTSANPHKVYYQKVEQDGDVSYIRVCTDNDDQVSGFYERKIRPLVRHNAGDTILTNRYDYTYGAVVTLSHDDVILTMAVDEPLTITSSPSTSYTTIHEDLFVSGLARTPANGTYNLTDRRATGPRRTWKHVSSSEEEVFDVTTIRVQTNLLLYKYFDDNGVLHYAAEPPPEYEYTTVSPNGTYYSSNHPAVKADAYVKSADNTTVDTRARNTDRKWYLMDGKFPYSFENQTGFSITFEAVGTDQSGLVEDWNLAFHYLDRNADEGTATAEFVILDPSVASSGLLTAVDQSKLLTDSYRSVYQEVYHVLAFNAAETSYGWSIYETVDPTLQTGLTECYHARVVYGLREEDMGEPWDLEWESVLQGDTTTPLITVLRSDVRDATASVEDALGTIVRYIKDNHQTITVDKSLYRYIDEGYLTKDAVFQEGKDYYIRIPTSGRTRRFKYAKANVEIGYSIPDDTYYEIGRKRLIDPLEGILFTCVPSAFDNRTPEPCNILDYRPGYPDPRYAERLLEVGVESSYAYELTEDRTFRARKVYYVKTGDGYSPVVVTEGEDVTPETYFERVYNQGIGAIYIRDPEMAVLTEEDIGLDLSVICDIVDLWMKNSSLNEMSRYRLINQETGVAIPLLQKLVSDSAPCYLSPWRKLVTVSSLEAVEDYVQNRKVANCTKSQLTDIQNAISARGVETYSSYDDILHRTGFLSYPLVGYVSSLNDLPEDLLETTLLPSADVRNGCLMYIDHVSDPVVILAGFSKEYCLEMVKAYGISSGFMTVLKEEDHTYYHYTSLKKDGYFDVNFKTCPWVSVDHWIWELEGTWFRDDGVAVPLKAVFNEDMSCAKPTHLWSDPILDENGNPVIKEGGGRSSIYVVDMLHCDYKLVLSDDADYVNYMTDIRELLRSYFLELKAATPSLLARTKMYFTPIRTFGNAPFKGSGGTNIILPLEFSVELGLHVESYVNGNDLNKDTIRTNILTLLTNRLKDHSLNLARLARDITDELGDNIIAVDVLGINGDKALQTLIPVNADSSPQLKQRLVLSDDGSVHTDRALDLTWFTLS